MKEDKITLLFPAVLIGTAIGLVALSGESLPRVMAAYTLGAVGMPLMLWLINRR